MYAFNLFEHVGLKRPFVEKLLKQLSVEFYTDRSWVESTGNRHRIEIVKDRLWPSQRLSLIVLELSARQIYNRNPDDLSLF